MAAIGSTSNPVYVNENGALTPCSGVQSHTHGNISNEGKVMMSASPADDDPVSVGYAKQLIAGNGGGGMFIDVTRLDTVKHIITYNKTYVCKVDSILMTYFGAAVKLNIKISADGNEWTTLRRESTTTTSYAAGTSLMFPLKAGTLVRVTDTEGTKESDIPNTVTVDLYPCKEYAEDQWEFYTKGSYIAWLDTGTYEFVIIGGGGGSSNQFYENYGLAATGGSAACFKGRFSVVGLNKFNVVVGGSGGYQTAIGSHPGNEGKNSSIQSVPSAGVYALNMIAPGGHAATTGSGYSVIAGEGTSYDNTWSGVTCTGVTKVSVDNGHAGNKSRNVGTAAAAAVANADYPHGSSYTSQWSSSSIPEGCYVDGYVYLKRVS